MSNYVHGLNNIFEKVLSTPFQVCVEPGYGIIETLHVSL